MWEIIILRRFEMLLKCCVIIKHFGRKALRGLIVIHFRGLERCIVGAITKLLEVVTSTIVRAAEKLSGSRGRTSYVSVLPGCGGWRLGGGSGLYAV